MIRRIAARRAITSAAAQGQRLPCGPHHGRCSRRLSSSDSSSTHAEGPTVVNIGGVRAAIPAGSVANPELVPHGFLRNVEQLPLSTLQLLRWLTQKQGLREDVFLLGPPGPSRRQAAMAWAELFRREVEVVSLSADTTESDLKQRREIVGGDVVFIDSAPVRAALHGRLLLLEGIERAERNVLPTLNNLLEAREMSLEDGRTIISARAWDTMLANEPDLTAMELQQRGLCRAHPQFMTVAIGLPVPPYAGKPLDPPLRSRFQGLSAVPALSGATVLDAIQVGAPQLFSGAGADDTGGLLGKSSAAHALVEFAELTQALTRAEAKSGGGGSESAVARLDLEPFVQAARTLAAFPLTPPHEALARVLPALLLSSDGGSGISGVGTAAMARAMQAAAETAFFPAGSSAEQRDLFPGYSLRRRHRPPAGADAAEEDRGQRTFYPNASSSDDSESLSRTYALPTGPYDDDFNSMHSRGGSEFVELPEPHSRLLCAMMADSSSLSWDNGSSSRGGGGGGAEGELAEARDLLLLGPKGMGKSALAVELLRQLGWGHAPVVFPLFRDIAARDLLQSRDTDEHGDTRWRDSPLVAAAKAGRPIILDNLHAARPDAVLGSLGRLLTDREVELPDGTLLKAAYRISPATADTDAAGPATDSCTHDGEGELVERVKVITIPSTFRVIALGCTDDPRNPLAEEVATLFSTHMLPTLEPAQLLAMARQRFPGAAPQRVEQLCALGEALEVRVEANRARLTEAERRTLRVSPRLLARLCRALAVDPALPDTELARGLGDGMLAPFMPRAARALLAGAMADVGLTLPGAEAITDTDAEPAGKGARSGGWWAAGDSDGQSAGTLQCGGGDEELLADDAIVVDEDAASGQRWLCVGSGGGTAAAAASGASSSHAHRVPVSVPARPELLPNAAAFYSNRAQDALLATMLRAVSAGERALLLIGVQGVGKNRLADRLIALLGREREYIQLHRDSTLSSLTVVPSLEDSKIVWHDSPLLRAARHGRILLVDEADKAPLEVVALLKQLVEDGSVLLGNGQRLARRRSSSTPTGNGGHVAVAEGEQDEDDERTIWIHPDFSLWVLANPAGFPFMGNDLFAQCGDVFRTIVVPNPDRVSEVQILASYAPDVVLTTLSRLAAAFGELRAQHALGKLSYPYSLREAVATARHLQAFPEESIGEALAGVLSFDAFDPRLMEQLAEIFARHEIDASAAWKHSGGGGGGGDGPGGGGAWQLRFERADGTSIPKTGVGTPKHGKVDPLNTPHVGGNTWAGGTGGSDTTGLGGRGGPYRLDAGHKVHQVSDKYKNQVLDEAAQRAREMGRAAMKAKLAEIGLKQHEWNQYEQMYSGVSPAVSQLRALFERMESRKRERTWLRRQSSGELDDTMLVDGKAGERLVFKRRAEADLDPLDASLNRQRRQRLRLVVDISGSMTRFNSYDGRLNKSLEAVMVVLEALSEQQQGTRIDASIQGHSGDAPDIPLVEWDQLPKNRAERLAVLQTMVTHSAYCCSGDHTLEGIDAAVQAVSDRAAGLGDHGGGGDDGANIGCVLVLSDANLRRYGIAPEELGTALTANQGVEGFCVLIGSLGNEAANVAAQVVGGRAVVCEDTADLPALVQELFASRLINEPRR